MVGIVGVGAIITYRSVFIALSIRGAGYTFSRNYIFSDTVIAKFPYCGSAVTSLILSMWAIFIPASRLGGDYTRRYWKLDRQGGCENMLEGLIGVMTMMER